MHPMPDCVTLTGGEPRKGQNRVLRGGSWNNDGRNLRSAYRNNNTPDKRNHNVGLRLAEALGAGGAINQRRRPVRQVFPGGRTRGPRRASRHFAQSLPLGRFTREPTCAA